MINGLTCPRDRAEPLTRVGTVRHSYHSVLPEGGTATDAAADALALRRDGAMSRYPDDVRCGYYLGYLEDRPEQVVGALRSIAIPVLAASCRICRLRLASIQRSSRSWTAAPTLSG